MPIWSLVVTILAMLIAGASLSVGFRKQSRERLAGAYFADSPQPMWVYDPKTLRFLDVNATALATYGYRREQFLRMTVEDIEPDMERMRKLLAHLPDDNHAVSRGWRHKTADGRLIDVDIASRSTTFQSQPARIVVATDVTERVVTEERLRLSETTLAQAQQIARLGSFYHDVRTKERRWSDVMYAVFGMQAGDPMPPEGIWKFDHPDDRELVRLEIEAARSERRPYDIDHRIVRADGIVRHVHEQGRWTYDEAGDEVLNIGTIIDITERKEAEAALAHLAYHDSLTGLPNRTKLIESLEEALATRIEDDALFALLFIDLDRFKIINDTLGHSYGDDVLVEIGKRLRARLSDTAIVARQGGDEFIVFESGLADKVEASHVAEQILETFKKPFTVSGHDHFISASIGVSLAPLDGEIVETLLQNADTAMYAAKKRGGNNFHFYTSNLQHAAAKRFKLESDLHRAIDRSEFSLYYQPVLSVKTGNIVAAEALLRWNDPHTGMVMPADFIEFAEETGLVLPLGDWIFKEAFVQAKLWSASGHRIKLWINVSAPQLHHPLFVASIRDRLTHTGLQASNIGLELTESSFINGRTETIATMRELKGMGLSLALDDFGVAYSSLDYVRRLPIDTIKIDRSFLHGIDTDRFNQSIVRGIVGIAHDLNLNVTAEGVETTAQFDFLADLGCDDWQGFYYAEAVPAPAFSRLLRSPRTHKTFEETYFGEPAV
ncbi:MAG: EAL domain-containing protein [Candidatus Eremiobacteraeota bacterium]|nr:EAL domain-containing protein [Candidatus Eremiobacteraeota bacterium]